jgi:hypothetical protein
MQSSSVPTFRAGVGLKDWLLLLAFRIAKYLAAKDDDNRGQHQGATNFTQN